MVGVESDKNQKIKRNEILKRPKIGANGKEKKRIVIKKS